MVEGAPHTAKRSMINCCAYGVPPAPLYKGARGEAAGQGGGRAKGGVLLLLGGGLLLLARPPRAGRPPPLLLYIRGGGHPRTHMLIINLSQPCAVPPPP